MPEAFGKVLSRLRQHQQTKEQLEMTQEELAAHIGRSKAYVGFLENGKVKPPDRALVWDIIRVLRLWPPACDDLMAAAGYPRTRTQEEEFHLQFEFPQVHEIWIFTPEITIDLVKWTAKIRENLLKGVRYRYFLSDDVNYSFLVERLLSPVSGEDRDKIKRRIECFLVRDNFNLFYHPFAIYNPPPTEAEEVEPDSHSQYEYSREYTYYCGSFIFNNEPANFYTLGVSHGEKCWKFLRWLQARATDQGHAPDIGVQRCNVIRHSFGGS